MREIAILVPYENEEALARDAVKQLKIADRVSIHPARTYEAVALSRAAIDEGARVVIARGLQAELIRSELKVPLVEIRLTAQEIGLLVRRAAEMCKQPDAVIGLLLFRNSVVDISRLQEITGVELAIEYVDRESEIPEAMERMATLSPDIVIGGSAVGRAAQNRGFKSMLLKSTGESVAQALRTALRMLHSVDLERQAQEQVDTVMGTAFNGIIKINRNREIISANRQAEQLTGRTEAELIGNDIMEFFPDIDKNKIDAVLSGDIDRYTTTMVIRNCSWALSTAVILYDNAISGAILSMYNLSADRARRAERELGSYMQGYAAKHSFSDLNAESRCFAKVLEIAKRYAASDAPILIETPIGCEDQQLAEAIHLNSPRRTGPFVTVEIAGFSAAEQKMLIFGEKGEESALDKAEHGTLFLRDIDTLAPALQLELARMMKPRSLQSNTFGSPMRRNVRVMAACRTNYGIQLRDELRYGLTGLVLKIPPLRDRREDLLNAFRTYLENCCRHYNAYLHLNRDVEDCVASLSWPGNYTQIKRFCEALVLSREKARLDGERVRSFYAEIFPEAKPESNTARIDPDDAKALDDLIKECRGDRSEVAARLGISTTTLWRRMKKFNLV